MDWVEEIDSKVCEMEKEICKIKDWSVEDIQESMDVLPSDQINLLLQNEIQRIDDWFSKTYYDIKSYLVKRNYQICDNTDFEKLKTTMNFISNSLNEDIQQNNYNPNHKNDLEKSEIKIDQIPGCSNEAMPYQNNDFYPNEIMKIIKTMEKNKYDKCTIQIIGKNLSCLLCMIRRFHGSVHDHVLGEKHQSNLSNPIQIEKLDRFHAAWSNIYPSLRIYEIYFLPHSKNQIECIFCNKHIAYEELLGHVEKEMKIPNDLMHLIQPVLNSKRGILKNYCNICNSSFSLRGLQRHINGNKHQMKLQEPNLIESRTVEQEINDGLCNICKIVLPLVGIQEHIHGGFHIRNWKKRSSTGNKIENNEDEVQCKLCKIAISRNNFQKHIDEMYHQEHLKLFNLKHVEGTEEYNQFECNVCKVPITCLGAELEKHKNGKSHLENVCQLYVNNSKYIEENATGNHIKCDICKIVVSRVEFQEHICRKVHQNNLNLNLLSLKFIEEKSKDAFYCYICEISCTSHIQEHIYTKKHQKKFNQFNPNSAKEKFEIVVSENSNGKEHQEKLGMGRNIRKTIDIDAESEENETKLEIHSFGKFNLFNQLIPSEYLKDLYILQLPETFPPWPLTIQQIASKYFRCLVCKIMFLESSSLNLHVSSDSHQANYNNEKTQSALRIYHKVWQSGKKIMKDQQIFFCPHDDQNIYCQLCAEAIKTKSVKTHCKKQSHIREVLDGPLCKKIEESLYQLAIDHLLSEHYIFKKENVFYRTEEFYTDDLLKKLDNKSHRIEKTILRVSPDIYNCLLCREKGILGSLLESHCSSASHLSFTKSEYRNRFVRRFHSVWSNLPADLQLHQIYFLPNSKNFTCLCCEKQVSIRDKKILNHIYKSLHIKYFKLFTQNAIPKFFDFTDESIQINLYPDSLTEILKQITGNPNDYISIQQFALFEIKCLVCRTKLKDITVHFTSNSHKNIIKDSVKVEAVKKYHKEWKKIPEILQIQQLNYEPYDGEHVLCNKCNNFLKYENLFDHLTDNHKFMEYNTPANRTQTEQEPSVEKTNDNKDQRDVCIDEISQSSSQEQINKINRQENLYHYSVDLVDEIVENQVICEVCRLVVSRNSLQEHINEREHQACLYQMNINQSKLADQKRASYCDVCTDTFWYRTPQEHIHDKVHLENLIKINLPLLKSINDKNGIKRIETKKITSYNLKLSELNPSEYFTDFYILQLTETVPRPLAIQKIGSKHFRCLVCKIMFVEINSLNLHVLSDTHQQNYNNETVQSALKIYHTIWRTYSEKINFHEIFFFPHNSRNVYCQLCLVAVEHSKIKMHCKNQGHLLEAVDGNLWGEIDESLYHEESDRIEKTIRSESNTYKIENVFHHTEQFYSDNLLRKLDNKSNRFEKTILMTSPGVYNCLLCNKDKIIGSLLENHCLSISHRSSMKSRFKNILVRQFHYDWSNFPADFQLHQIYFLPNYVTYICLCCRKNIAFRDILNHVYGSTHIKNFKLLHPNAIPKCFDLTNEPTQMRLYPESLTELLEDKSVKKYLKFHDNISFQKISLFEMKCLVCKTKFENIQSHLSRTEHKKFAQNEEKVKALKKYLTEWKKVPENLQIQQLNYDPYDAEHIMCNKCNDFLHYENLYYHLTNNHKLGEIKTSISPSNSSQFEQKSTSSLLTIPKCKFAPSTYYPINLLQKMRKLEGKIYRNVQMIGESSFRCLLCKICVEDLHEHVSTSDHLKLLSDKELISFVEKFHNSWAIIDNYLQFQQVYFFPSSETVLSCVLCLKDVNYNNLVAHLQITQHRSYKMEKNDPLMSIKSSNSKLDSSITLVQSSSETINNETDNTNVNEDAGMESNSSEDLSDESDIE